MSIAEYYRNSHLYDLALTVGRCDHERTCGYHYSPSDFRQQTKTGVLSHSDDWTPPPPPPTAPALPWSLVDKSAQPFRSNLVKYWKDVVHLPYERLNEVLKMYHVGATRDSRIIYWMIDIDGNVKDGKMMAYNSDGHRDKCRSPLWAWKRLISYQPKDKQEEMSKWIVSRPYFGEHLLSDPKLNNNPVGLVEGEKSALICSVLLPNVIWIAIGTKYFNRGRLSQIIKQERDILLYPDYDGIDDWIARANEELNGYSKKYVMSDYIRSNSVEANDDIGDILIRQYINNYNDVINNEGINILRNNLNLYEV